MYMGCLFRHEWYAISLSDLFGLQEYLLCQDLILSFCSGEQIVDTHIIGFL